MAKGGIDDQLEKLRSRWKEYREGGNFEQFVEFTLALNNLAERLSRLRLPGLVRQCEGLENAAMGLYGAAEAETADPQTIALLDRQIESLLAAIANARRVERDADQRSRDASPSLHQLEWVKLRTIWVFANAQAGWSPGLAAQLSYFGFQVRVFPWFHALPDGDSPFAAVFLPDQGADELDEAAMADIRRIRAACPASQLYCVGVPQHLPRMVDLMRSGIDVTIQRDDHMSALLSSLLDLVQAPEADRYRVLIVEDSRTSLKQIERALQHYGVECRAITDPSRLFEAFEEHQPDLVLMDMYMPGCNGVEATRALRQMTHWRVVPVVYLSSETDVALQVEALRLGGDQFLTKPFNPVLLAATVKTTIERHRAILRASCLDSLTGLLNHTTSKAELDARLAVTPEGGRLSVAMIDIDHFKSVNDSYGHPVGDRVIRGLAWLLKGWLRSTDVIGRYGGEEFIVALPGVTAHEAHKVLDGIRAHFANLPHSHAGGTLRATFSAGVADYPHFQSATDLIEAADQALLEAKSLGRNRVIEAVPPIA